MDELNAPLLIIAMPQLMDPNFHRTVVLVVERNEQGAFGLVVNRLGENRVQDLCSGLEVAWGGEQSALALYGGPVGAEQGFLLHGALPDDVVIGSREIVPGLSMASDMESFRTLCRRPPEDLRILLGYSGWGPGQLESEIMAGAWLTSDVRAELVFQTPIDEIWERTLRRLGVDPAMLVTGSGMH